MICYAMLQTRFNVEQDRNVGAKKINSWALYKSASQKQFPMNSKKYRTPITNRYTLRTSLLTTLQQTNATQLLHDITQVSVLIALHWNARVLLQFTIRLRADLFEFELHPYRRGAAIVI